MRKNEPEKDCSTCKFQQEAMFKTMICTHPKALTPTACVCAFERCLGKHWKAKEEKR